MKLVNIFIYHLLEMANEAACLDIRITSGAGCVPGIL
jgi:hypothetical protein